MTSQIRELIIRQLCLSFQLDYDKIQPVEIQKLLYIHHFIVIHENKVFLKDIVVVVESMQVTLKSRSRIKKLNELYWQLKLSSIITCERYDTTTLHPPAIDSYF